MVIICHRLPNLLIPAPVSVVLVQVSYHRPVRQWVAAPVVASLLPAFVTVLRPPAARVAVRVAGSWIAAIAMLMLGWLIRGAGA